MNTEISKRLFCQAPLETAWAPTQGLNHQMYPLKMERGAPDEKLSLPGTFVMGSRRIASSGTAVAKGQRSHPIAVLAQQGPNLWHRLFRGDGSSVPA